MRAVLAVAIVALLTGCGAGSTIAEEKTEIINLLQASQSGGELLIEPVIVRTDYSIADWVQGESGGRSLLRKERGAWKVVATAGEELRDVEYLTKAGVPAKEAKALVNSLLAKERGLPEEKLARFDRTVDSPPPAANPQ